MLFFAQLVLTLLLYIAGALAIGMALTPAVLFGWWLWEMISPVGLLAKSMVISFSIGMGYFIYGVSLMFVVWLMRLVLGLKLEEGYYRPVSFGMLKWMVYNALILLVSTTFMDFMLLTPLINLFYRLMGAKLGKGVQVNSKYCADLCLLEIGDNSVIGGHSTVIAHSFERGGLILKKVRIGKNVTVGLNSVILPGAEIGDGAIIPAGSVLPKNAKLEPRKVWRG